MKRILLFILSNIAVMFTLTALYFLITFAFWIPTDGKSIGSVAAFSLIFWFGSAIISLAFSKTFAKFAYSINTVDFGKLAYSPDSKLKTIHDTISRIALAENVKIPEFWIYDDFEPNAFATGPTKNSALVAVSTGLLESMDENEIAWVIGHEMAHIYNGDMVTMTLLQWLMNSVVLAVSHVVSRILTEALKLNPNESIWLIVNQIIFMISQVVFGLATSIVTMAFSRHREYVADSESAKHLWKWPMIAALSRLKELKDKYVSSEKDAVAALQISSYRQKTSVFATHPSLDDRINALTESL